MNTSIIKYPIAINSNHLDMRILSQKSCFTIHGMDKRDLEAILMEARFDSQFFLRYEIPADQARKLFKQLLALGITCTNMYPDLSGLAKELKVRFEE